MRTNNVFRTLLLAIVLAMPALTADAQQPPPAPGGPPPMAQQHRPHGEGRGQGHRAHRGQQREQMKLMRIAYLTEALGLTTETAQRFWPVYNARETELEALREERRREIRGTRRPDTVLTDAQATRLADLQIEFQQREVQIMAAHHVKLKAVLSPQQLLKLYRAEKEFKHKMHAMRRGPHGQPGQPGPHRGGPHGPRNEGGHHRGPDARPGHPQHAPQPPAPDGEGDDE